MSTLVIGKADKFFTLWSKSEDNDGTAIYNYLRNISEDFEKVRAQYPDNEFNEWLRGKGIWKVSDKIYEPRHYEPGVMAFGKHQNEKIIDLPVDYACWLFNNYEPEPWDANCCNWWESTLDALEVLLRENNYMILEIGTRRTAVLMKNVQIERECQLAELIEKHEALEVFCKSSLTSGGSAFCDGLWLEFPTIRQMYYQGYDYALPVKNGKAKRIKNKTLRITDYDAVPSSGVIMNEKAYHHTFTISVKDFEII